MSRGVILTVQLYQRVEACVAEWLTPPTPDLAARVSSLVLRIVSLNKELYFTLSLFTQV